MLTHVEALERFASRSASALSRRCGTGCGAARCASANAIRSCSREDTTLSKRAVCSLSRVAALPSSTAVPTAAFRSASSASDTVAAREDQDAIHSRATRPLTVLPHTEQQHVDRQLELLRKGWAEPVTAPHER